jgi:uncharacterized damage-inducible protein DinB
MRRTLFALTVATLSIGGSPCRLDAQERVTPSIVTDLVNDVAEAERKFLALARAIPEEKFSWRPAPGVRSISEVVMHVASDNYLIPAALGFPADPATGIKGDDYNSALTFEKRTVTKAQAIAEMEKSFAFLRQSMNATTGSRLRESVQMFGQPLTMQRGWILGATHLHEHLGQLIAYARSNGVKPPWSQGPG